MYINTGAMVTESGLRVPTKKRLKELMKTDPSSVTFDPTSVFNVDQTPFDGSHIPTGSKLSVVGPDPQYHRQWFATVEHTPKGIKVS